MSNPNKPCERHAAEVGFGIDSCLDCHRRMVREGETTIEERVAVIEAELIRLKALIKGA